jgi:hypothetical protein
LGVREGQVNTARPRELENERNFLTQLSKKVKQVKDEVCESLPHLAYKLMLQNCEVRNIVPDRPERTAARDSFKYNLEHCIIGNTEML